MIGRVYRGANVAGLVRYLYGPGRHHEHENPHLVAAWDAASPADLAVLEAEIVVGLHAEQLAGDRVFELAGAGGGALGAQAARADFRPLVAELEAPLAYAERPPGEPVWHCALRAAPDDRILSDDEWAQVAADLMHRTGIAPQGDDGACRWVAVRHDQVSIHVVAVLARQDGAPVRLWRDYPKVRATCLAAETTFGLTSTAPADGTNAAHTSRPEVEKAKRHGGEPARDRLRREVRAAAVAAHDLDDFLSRLEAAGLRVRRRHSTRPGREHEVTGYAVAVPGDKNKAGQPVFYGGGRLAPDLTLPRLQRRWHSDGQPVAAAPAASPSAGVGGAGRRATVLREAAEVARTAGRAPAGPALAAVTSDLLVALARCAEGRAGGPLTAAADRYDRSARTPWNRDEPGGTPEPEGWLDLRFLARDLSRAGRAVGADDAAALAELAAATAALVTATARWHAAERRAHQAAAARAAADALRRWREQSNGVDCRAPVEQRQPTLFVPTPGHERSGPAR